MLEQLHPELRQASTRALFIEKSLATYFVIGPQDVAPLHRSVLTTVSEAIEGGITFLQLRAKPAGAREVLALSRAISEILRALPLQRRPLFVIDDRVDVAAAAQREGLCVDGVHVGQSDLPVDRAFEMLAPGSVVGLSANTAETVLAPDAARADYIGIGAYHSTVSKADAGAGLGARRFAELTALSRVPAVAIGGVTAADAPDVVRAGGAGLCVISAIARAADVRAAAADLATSWESAVAQAKAERTPRRARILSIAGTDPSGGAGLMADLRTVAALEAYGMGVVTNVVAQNTQGVRAVSPVSAEMVRAQLQAVSEDVTIDGVKIGMLGSSEIIDTVRLWLGDLRAGGDLHARRDGSGREDAEHDGAVYKSAAYESAGTERERAGKQPSHLSGTHIPVVLDPVMISTSGTRLLDPGAVSALRSLLESGLIDVVTPNIPELAALLEEPVARDWNAVLRQAAEFSRRAGIAVYAKAGHLEGSHERSDALVSWGDNCGADECGADYCGRGAQVSSQSGSGDGSENASRTDESAREPRIVGLPGTLISTENTHGTGCTLSSALVTFRAQELRQGGVGVVARDPASASASASASTGTWAEAALRTKAFMNRAIAHADELMVGKGHGPVDQLWNTTYRA